MNQYFCLANFQPLPVSITAASDEEPAGANDLARIQTWASLISFFFFFFVRLFFSYVVVFCYLCNKTWL